MRHEIKPYLHALTDEQKWAVARAAERVFLSIYSGPFETAVETNDFIELHKFLELMRKDVAIGVLSGLGIDMDKPDPAHSLDGYDIRDRSKT